MQQHSEMARSFPPVSSRLCQTRADALEALGTGAPPEGIAVEWLLDQADQRGGQ
ncbi:hypothetical protein [Roseovarius faecimaris]|uniref:hypothetical protein n=1 Tax=Roseovarius faecimaris TaxID=2494550 RepID=UPI0012FDE0BD|nr:hypothetical protein [Roseovarius faecimaris]